ncbi:hypothetical protein [Halostagnicola kamekurae]|uniref:Uncharacterized protein n=1 Tax=Halostagnicola kamekurae TaxID=619731 RepID=A0A1I6V0V9_9EURY|nr:hypothetical protein [Halostagnicola kamekurae]SFT07371.1 hypothetical protein SAMN04488556_4235 [Halostagnicola kamekurae]
MKPGAGDDLLSDDSEGDESEESADTGVNHDLLDPDEPAEETDLEPTDDTGSDSSDGYSLPWIHRRDTVKSDRPEIIQMHVRGETVNGERDLQDDVEDLLGEDVYALDVREAAYLVAMQHPEEVASQLREWGYDIE